MSRWQCNLYWAPGVSGENKIWCGFSVLGHTTFPVLQLWVRGESSVTQAALKLPTILSRVTNSITLALFYLAAEHKARDTGPNVTAHGGSLSPPCRRMWLLSLPLAPISYSMKQCMKYLAHSRHLMRLEFLYKSQQYKSQSILVGRHTHTRYFSVISTFNPNAWHSWSGP